MLRREASFSWIRRPTHLYVGEACLSQLPLHVLVIGAVGAWRTINAGVPVVRHKYVQPCLSNHSARRGLSAMEIFTSI